MLAAGFVVLGAWVGAEARSQTKPPPDDDQDSSTGTGR
jgi:hypothetical protein